MSLRQWLSLYPPSSRSTSPDIGYQNVRYANGVFVAVGFQKGFPPNVTSNPSAGGPVSCSGCSWSTDGVNWTDSILPFTGTSMVYFDAQFDGLGRWIAGACEYVGTTGRRTYLVTSTDNATTWSAPNLIVEEFFALHGSNGKHFVVSTGGGVIRERQYNSGSLFTTRTLSSAWAASTARSGDYIVMLDSLSARVFNGGAFATAGSGWFTLAGVTAGNAATLYRPFDGSHGLLSDFWALVSDQPNGTVNVAANQRGRDIWRSANGQVWTKVSTLPFVSGQIGPYYKLAYASNLGLMAAIGDGIFQVTKDGTSWSAVSVPAGAWRGVASDGTDFVCVSATGDRLKVAGSALLGRM